MPYQFEVAKLSRAIRVYGTKYRFMRANLDSFDEPTDENVLVLDVNGIYHEQTSYISLTASDAGIVPKKITPYIDVLASDLMDENGKYKVQQEDSVTINSKEYKVTGINNLSNLNILCEICLEEVIPDGRYNV